MGTTKKHTNRSDDDISTLIASQFGRFLGAVTADLLIRRLRRYRKAER